MKQLSLLLMVAAVTFASGQPHRHAHPHSLHNVAKRQEAKAAIDGPAPVATVVVYVLNGHPIAEEEVRQGIANGTLLWGDDGDLSTFPTIQPTAAPIPSAVVEPLRPSALNQDHSDESTSKSAPSRTSEPIVATAEELQNSHRPTSRPTSQPTAQQLTEPSPQAQPSQSDSQLSEQAGLDREFPNGKFACNDFPLGYGATPVEHAGLGGWIGIQYAQVAEMAGFDDITTTPHGSCSDGTCCKPGSFCSYSCPPGYLKSSWPEQQGKKGQSVGGLKCNLDGKLEMADGSIAKTLCVHGTDKVTVKVLNKLKRKQSICRTDYPGTESETIPITTHPGESAELACPDNSMYYHWNGKPTSAQYYINNAGVDEKEACQWGDGTRPVGNYAPLNLGVGFNHEDQRGYIALFQNSPTTNEKLDFTVELQADDMDGNCKYSNGEFRHGDNYGEVAKGDNRGCTVALKSGILTVVLTEN